VHRIPTLALVGAYLAAIVAANLLVAHDPSWVYVNGFLFIGLDLTTRDVLHDRWGARRVPYLALMVIAGSIISYLLNDDAQRIAIASTVAFAAAFTTDAVIYARVHRRPFLERANMSNIPAAVVDSIVFPLIAFPGPLDWKLVAGLAAAKIGGGAVWAIVLDRTAFRDPVSA
jgi:uncharacterized PurR-regulated membrane protein YhhQ (DUF165 family)